jgi:regulator of sigma E protease
MIIIYALVLLGILIFVHELGHFVIAKLLGVKVLKFSLGFGPKIIGKTVGETEYRLAYVPLGGYVKMLGENPGEELMESDKHRAFNYQSVWKRFAIVFFGPLFNICFSAFVLFFIFMHGVPVSYPDVGEIKDDSPAIEAGLMFGDRVLKINGETVETWNDVEYSVEKSSGKSLSFEIERGGGIVKVSVIPEKMMQQNIFGEDVETWDIGISPLMYPEIDEVVEESPAARAGIKKGDWIIEIGGKSINSWQDVSEIIHDSPGKALPFSIKRDGSIIKMSITPESKTVRYTVSEKKEIGLIGIKPVRNDFIKQYKPVDAFVLGIKRTWDFTRFTAITIVKLLQRIVPFDTIGGPILIVQIAGEQASKGVLDFFFFMAVISINLGVLNLLPIPVLDGGHLMFLGLEAIRRKPLSENAMVVAQKIGLVLIITLIVFVFYNDILRLVTGRTFP